MANPEAEVRVSPGNLSPEEIAQRAVMLWEQRKTGVKMGGAISKPVAVALIMQEEGRSTINKLLGQKDRLTNPNDVGRFMSGIGAIFLGGLLQSLEQSVLEPWDDQLFINNLNQAFEDTPILRIDIPVAKILIVDGIREGEKIQEVTETIRETLLRDRTFLAFLEFPDNLKVLPSFAQRLFSMYKNPFSMAVSVYKQVIAQPIIKNSQ